MTRPSGSSIVTKCTKIIDILVEARQPLSFSAIVEASGYVKSSAHRILAVLLSEHLAEYDAQTRTYTLGARIGHWARVAWLRTDIQQLAAIELEKLCDSTGMNVALSVLDNDAILYLRTIDAIQVRFAARAGDHAPLHCTAAGKVFLAYMPERQRAAVLGKPELEGYTQYTIREPAVLTQELQQIRKQGYGVAEQEEFLRVLGIAAPVWNHQQTLSACISLWSLTDQTGQTDMAGMQQHLPALLAAAKRISRQMS